MRYIIVARPQVGSLWHRLARRTCFEGISAAVRGAAVRPPRSRIASGENHCRRETFASRRVPQMVPHAQ